MACYWLPPFKWKALFPTAPVSAIATRESRVSVWFHSPFNFFAFYSPVSFSFSLTTWTLLHLIFVSCCEEVRGAAAIVFGSTSWGQPYCVWLHPLRQPFWAGTLHLLWKFQKCTQGEKVRDPLAGEHVNDVNAFKKHFESTSPTAITLIWLIPKNCSITCKLLQYIFP